MLNCFFISCLTAWSKDFLKDLFRKCFDCVIYYKIKKSSSRGQKARQKEMKSMKINLSDEQLHSEADYVIVQVDDTPVSMHLSGESIGNIEMNAFEWAKENGLEKPVHMCDESWSTRGVLSVIRRTYHSERYPLTERGKSQEVARHRKRP